MSRFRFGAKTWPGIAKLVEELGEVIQVCGKLMNLRTPDLRIAKHWSGNLKEKLEDELGDARAAITFVTLYCGLDHRHINEREAMKFPCLSG